MSSIDDRSLFAPTFPARIDPARVSIVEEPAAELHLVADALVQQTLRPASDDDAALITMLLKLARKRMEKLTGLAFITQTLRVTFDRLPDCTKANEIELPRAPLQSIDAITYLDEAGAEQDFDVDNVSTGLAADEVGPADSFGKIRLNPDASWPSLGSFPRALRIDFVAGFGDTAADVPPDLSMAVLFLAKHYYELIQSAGTSYNPAADEAVPAFIADMISGARIAFIA